MLLGKGTNSPFTRGYQVFPASFLEDTLSSLIGLSFSNLSELLDHYAKAISGLCVLFDWSVCLLSEPVPHSALISAALSPIRKCESSSSTSSFPRLFWLFGVPACVARVEEPRSIQLLLLCLCRYGHFVLASLWQVLWQVQTQQGCWAGGRVSGFPFRSQSPGDPDGAALVVSNSQGITQSMQGRCQCC